MSENVYYVVLVNEHGEVYVSKLTKSQLIDIIQERANTDELMAFIDSVGFMENAGEWIGGDEDTAILIIKGGEIVMPDITQKIERKCTIK